MITKYFVIVLTSCSVIKGFANLITELKKNFVNVLILPKPKPTNLGFI